MAASTAPEAKRRILALLTPRSGLTGVKITWGGPSKESEVTHDMIHFEGATTRATGWEILGGRDLDERYTLTLEVTAIKKSAAEQATEERAWALIDEIEQAIRGDLNLGGLLIEQVDFGEQTVDLNPLTDGWLAKGTLALDCHARI